MQELEKRTGATRKALGRPHQERVAAKGTHLVEFYGLIHTPVTDYLKIPEAREALNKEWEKLENIPYVDFKAVRPKAQVKAEAQKNGQSVHFAQLMALCFLKNAELDKSLQQYKGRAALRGPSQR